MAPKILMQRNIGNLRYGFADDISDYQYPHFKLSNTNLLGAILNFTQKVLILYFDYVTLHN